MNPCLRVSTFIRDRVHGGVQEPIAAIREVKTSRQRADGREEIKRYFAVKEDAQKWSDTSVNKRALRASQQEGKVRRIFYLRDKKLKF